MKERFKLLETSYAMKKYSKNEVKEKGKNRHGRIHDFDCLLTKIPVLLIGRKHIIRTDALTEFLKINQGVDLLDIDSVKSVS